MKFIYLLIDKDNSINNTFGVKFKEQVIVYPYKTPPTNFLPKLSYNERKRIYTHLDIWKKEQSAIILEDCTYTNLDDDELMSYLYFGRSNSLVETEEPAICFYGKFDSMCLSHCEEVSIVKKSLFKTEACAGAYAYMINGTGCKKLISFFEGKWKKEYPKDLDSLFYYFTSNKIVSAYTYHPSIVKNVHFDRYECLMPNEEEKRKRIPVRHSFYSWFVFLCILFLIFLLGLIIYYVYRICLCKSYNKIISTGYYEENSC